MRITKETFIEARNNGFQFETCGSRVVSIPLQYELQKWLREEHCIHITIPVPITITKSKRLYCFTVNDNKGNTKRKGFVFKTYEEALEAALLEAIKMISINQTMLKV